MRIQKKIFLAMSVMLACGCSMQSPLQSTTARESIGENTTPLTVDGAMELRDWNRSTSLYSNGGTPAGPTGFLFEERWYEPNWTYSVVETPLFVAQTLALPVTLAIAPPWTTVIYHGDRIGPTYTAMPPVPPLPNQPMPTTQP
jgi:hypothetical protein